MFKRATQHAILLIVSMVIGLAIGEVALAIDGRYNGLATRPLVASPAIWEPRADVTRHQSHPDLEVNVAITTDPDGVRNHSAVRTSLKRKIIGFFGDSFTENRRVEDRFAFTTMLDEAAGDRARVVNYGVDGYGLDQSYLRYKKYEHHDIRHVVYLFCGNDLRNLYETGLAAVGPGEAVEFQSPAPRLFSRVVGRLRLTYLILTVYHQLKGTPPNAIRQQLADLMAERRLSGHQARFHDAFADVVDENLMADAPAQRTRDLARLFVLVLGQWRSEVEDRGRSFTVLVLPREEETALAQELLRSYQGRVIYLQELLPEGVAPFKTDDHWNEYGNLQVAEVLAGLRDLPFHGDFVRPEVLKHRTREIEEYYSEHR